MERNIVFQFLPQINARQSDRTGFSAKNQPPYHHLCKEKTASKTIMKLLRPKVATNAKGSSGNVDTFQTP